MPQGRFTPLAIYETEPPKTKKNSIISKYLSAWSICMYGVDHPSLAIEYMNTCSHPNISLTKPWDALRTTRLEAPMLFRRFLLKACYGLEYPTAEHVNPPTPPLKLIPHINLPRPPYTTACERIIINLLQLLRLTRPQNIVSVSRDNPPPGFMM